MQKTTFLKQGEFEREWFVVDASGKTLGRLATRISRVLRGKHKPGYAPHMDVGDFVIVVNAGKINVTGNKLQDKTYWSHTKHPGGLRIMSLKEKMEKDPTFAVRNAVRGMLPHNRLGRRLLKKLKIYAGGNHPHKSQQPKELQI